MSSIAKAVSLIGRLAKTVGEQVGEACEGFPAGGGAGESAVEADVEDQRFAGGVAYRPEVAHGVSAQEGLREMPELAGETELSFDGMRNRQALAELRPAHGPLPEFREHGVGVVMKAFHVGAGQH